MGVKVTTDPASERVTATVALWFVVANHDHHGILRDGARCYVAHDTGLDRVSVLVAPKGRRWAEVWTRPNRLRDIRIVKEEVREGSKLHHFAGKVTLEKATALLQSMLQRGSRPRVPLENNYE